MNNLTDNICLLLDNAVRAMFGSSHTTGRDSPAENLPEINQDDCSRKHTTGCMRVNHAGEVAAQGLYHGQALVSRSLELKQHLNHAAVEEGDHLAWCNKRLKELNSRTSYLSPVWYSGAFAIGSIAGILGDRWSLGFIAETETQVMKHLKSHINEIPSEDQRTQAILKQMHSDESSHCHAAEEQGAAKLPKPIRNLMKFASKIMVKTAYWV